MAGRESREPFRLTDRLLQDLLEASDSPEQIVRLLSLSLYDFFGSCFLLSASCLSVKPLASDATRVSNVSMMAFISSMENISSSISRR